MQFGNVQLGTRVPILFAIFLAVLLRRIAVAGLARFLVADGKLLARGRFLLLKDYSGNRQ